MPKRWRIALACAVLVLAGDVATKVWASAALASGRVLEVIPGFFRFVLVHNRGAAFGFLNTPDMQWQRWFFLAVSVLALACIAWLLRHAPESARFHAAGLGCIAGGAVGNAIDRIRFGHVVDFLDVYVGSWHWPAFNVADSGITVGAGLVLLSMYMERRQRRGTRIHIAE
jgi:signal peptidase II